MNLHYLPPVFADRGRLERIFLNLLANALKYSEEASRVDVLAEAAGSEVSVSIITEGAASIPKT